MRRMARRGRVGRGALVIGEDGGFPPRRDQVQPHGALAGSGGFLGMHVDADGAAVDLAHRQRHQLPRRDRQR
jgi:hypothetical protein